MSSYGPGDRHPLHDAFAEPDAFPCGSCVPGQIVSGSWLLREGRTGTEAMVGNPCRCGAYPNIVAAGGELSDR